MAAQKSPEDSPRRGSSAGSAAGLCGDDPMGSDGVLHSRRGPQEISRAITDAVTQSNLVTLGNAAAYSLGQNYLGGSQAQGLLFANMVQSQGELSAQGRAVTQESAHLILSPRSDTAAPQVQQAVTAEPQHGPLMADSDTGDGQDGDGQDSAEGTQLTSTATGAPVTTNTNVNLEGLDEALQTLMGGRPVVT
ncbi:RebB family R body protein [Rhodovibrionaceae bacterium A322]